MTVAPGGIRGAAATGLIAAAPGAAARAGWGRLPAEAALAPAGPAAPISTAAASPAVYAGHVRRFSIPCPP